jgi:hypothetical protein
MNPKNLVELILDDASEGVFAISLVRKPAIESDFLALSDAKVLLKIEDAEKRIVTGAILIPNLPILRKDENGDDYHIFFSEDTVETLAGKYLLDANQANVNLEHSVPVENITLIESWIKKDAVHDKSVHLGIDAPVGTWLGTMKVDDDEVWEDWIKAGHLRGFSVEAQLKQKVEMSKVETILEEIKNMLTSKKEEVVEASAEVTETVEVETVTKEEFVALCGQVEEIGNLLKDYLAKKEEVDTVEVEAEAVEPEKVEEPKEEVEMLSHTDADEEVVNIPAPKFEYKLSTSERIAKAMKQF